FIELARRERELALELGAGKHRAAPQRERTVELARRCAITIVCERVARALDELFEPIEIQLSLFDAEPVGASAGDDPLGTERSAKRVDVHLQRRHRRTWRVVVPHRGDEPVARHGLVALPKKPREHGELLRPAECDRLAADHGLERPENPELHLPAGPFRLLPMILRSRSVRWKSPSRRSFCLLYFAGGPVSSPRTAPHRCRRGLCRGG